ncbi:MAG: arginase family protein [Catalinimonas sp.]
MNIDIFFDPVEEYLVDEVSDLNSVRHQITVHHGIPFPEWATADIAVIGLSEVRGARGQQGAAGAAGAVRSAWYRLKKGAGRYRIVDLGNLRNGRTLEETYERLRAVCDMLLQNDVLTVLVGGTHDLHLGAYRAFEDLDQRITVLNLDARVDLEGDDYAPNRTHLNELITHQPNYLFNFVHAAHQAYLVDAPATFALEKLNFDLIRLGQIHDDVRTLEPFAREAQMLSFDAGAIRQQDAPGAGGLPFGMSAEEACQLAWYAAYGHALQLAGLYEYDPDHDRRGQTAGVLAVMLWHLVEGYYHRPGPPDFDAAFMTRYVVPTHRPEGAAGQPLIFYKRTQTGQWWLEVPGADDVVRRVPCGYADYQQACAGVVPDRWITSHARLI